MLVTKLRRSPLTGLVAISLIVSMPGCAFLQSLTGKSLPVPGLGAGTAALSGAGLTGSLSPSQLTAAATTTTLMRSGNLSQLTSVAVNLGVPAAVTLGRLAAKSIQTAIERRAEERQRQLQAQQLFYSGQCNLEIQPATAKTGDDIPALESQAEAAFQKGDLAAADAALQKAIKKAEGQGKNGQADLSRLLNRQAAVYLAKSELAKAEPPAQKALELREKVLGKSHPDVAESLNTVGIIAQTKSDYGRAEKSYTRALSIREEALKGEHICVAQSANQLGNLYKEMAAYNKAEPLYTRALSIREAKLGKDSLEVAQSHTDLGSLKQAMGNYAAAEPSFLRALEVRKTKLGADHPDVAETQNELGTLYKLRGAYPQAESRYQQALAIREKKLSSSDPRIGESLDDLAALYQSMGDYKAAEPLLTRSLELRQKTLGSDHPDVAESLDHLAQLHAARGEFTEAQAKYQSALKIRETKLGKQHPAVAETCRDLGELHFKQGDLAGAESFHDRALDIRKKALGLEHPATAESMFQLATIYRAKGEFIRAEPLFRQSLELREKMLGPNHPSVAESLVGLATTLVGNGRLPAALQQLERALTISEGVLRSLSGSSNEGRVDAFLRTLRLQEDTIYSLLTEKKLDDGAVKLAAMTALLRKGRSVDEAADTSRALFQGLPPEQQQKLAALREVRTRRADLALSGAGIYPPDVYQKLLKELQDSEDAQLKDLLKESTALRKKLHAEQPGEILGAVQKSLPDDGVLVEIVAFRQIDFRPTAQRPQLGPGAVRYAALVLPPKGQPTAADLGPGEAMDQAVAKLLAALTDPEADWQAPAKSLDELLFEKVRDGVNGKARLFVSPDGQLSLVPLQVLPADGKNTLLDKVELTYLTSGRDLLRKDEGAEAKSSVALVSDPKFSIELKDAEEDSAASRSGLWRGLRLGKVAPLPGTKQEAKAIEKLLKKSEIQTLSGSDATKTAFLRIEQPGILHVATHGLFVGETTRGGDTARGLVLEDDDKDKARPVEKSATAAGKTARPAFAENPLLSSMLVLAGAETATRVRADRRDPEVGNGLVTALEMASMNLWGTQLVVLSACETGRGDVSNLGQGVYGLRRAVMVAGAETLLTSLWKVDDKATKDLMTRYYKKLLSGSGRSAAMRDAALALRKKHAHPYFWAPFIAVGKAGPMEGIGKGKKGAAKAADDDDGGDDDK